MGKNQSTAHMIIKYDNQTFKSFFELITSSNIENPTMEIHFEKTSMHNKLKKINKKYELFIPPLGDWDKTGLDRKYVFTLNDKNLILVAGTFNEMNRDPNVYSDENCQTFILYRSEESGYHLVTPKNITSHYIAKNDLNVTIFGYLVITKSEMVKKMMNDETYLVNKLKSDYDDTIKEELLTHDV